MGNQYYKGASKLSNPFDALFLNITKLGEEIAFLAVTVAILWCYDKRFGLFMGLNFFDGVFYGQYLKNVIKRPRPFLMTAISIGAPTLRIFFS